MSAKTAPHQQTIAQVHKSLITLNNLIGFYYDEMLVYERRLEEVVKKNTGKDILAEAEHFQNQFIVQKEQLDILKHEINLKKDEIARMMEAPAYAARRLDDGGLSDKLNDVEKNYSETRSRFYRFLAEVF